MTITYTWKILDVFAQDSLEHKLENVILKIFWEKRGTDELGNSFGHMNITNLEFSAENFTPFRDLTEDTVWSWIKAHLTWEDSINSQIAAELNNMRNPVKSVLFPWMPNPQDEILPENRISPDYLADKPAN